MIAPHAHRRVLHDGRGLLGFCTFARNHLGDGFTVPSQTDLLLSLDGRFHLVGISAEIVERDIHDDLKLAGDISPVNEVSPALAHSFRREA